MEDQQSSQKTIAKLIRYFASLHRPPKNICLFAPLTFPTMRILPVAYLPGLQLAYS